MPDTRSKIIRGAVIGFGVAALVGGSVLVGRLSASPASAEPAAAEQAADGGHNHGATENPALLDIEVEPWSDKKTYTDAHGNQFTILVKLEEPKGMGMCTMGPMASEYSRSITLSIRNESGKKINGPRVGVADRRIAFQHGKYGCSWVYPPGVEESYAPGEGKTFRGLIETEPKGEDVVLTVRPPLEDRKPDGKATEKEIKAALAAPDPKPRELFRIPAEVLTGSKK